MGSESHYTQWSGQVTARYLPYAATVLMIFIKNVSNFCLARSTEDSALHPLSAEGRV